MLWGPGPGRPWAVGGDFGVALEGHSEGSPGKPFLEFCENAFSDLGPPHDPKYLKIRPLAASLQT